MTTLAAKLMAFFACTVSYADDLVLLCPSLQGILTKLDTCGHVADKCGLAS